MGLSPPASLQSWANAQMYRFEEGQPALAQERSRRLGTWPPCPGSAGPCLQGPKWVLAPMAPVNGSSYLLELLVDDFVNLVRWLHLPSKQA